MSRTACLFAILATSACAAQSWSFDHDAGAGEAGVAALDDAEVSDHRPLAGRDAALAGGPVPEAGPDLEKDSAPEASQKCSEDDDCPSDAPLCGQPAGLCLRCSADVDCSHDADADDASTNAVCNASTGACVECTSNSTCSASSADTLPYCDTATDRCVRCLKDTDCGLESACLLTTHSCTRML